MKGVGFGVIRGCDFYKIMKNFICEFFFGVAGIILTRLEDKKYDFPYFNLCYLWDKKKYMKYLSAKNSTYTNFIFLSYL